MCVNGTDLQVIEFRSCYGVTVSLINADRLDVKQFPLGKECFVGNNSANRKSSWSRKCINDFEDGTTCFLHSFELLQNHTQSNHEISTFPRLAIPNKQIIPPEYVQLHIYSSLIWIVIQPPFHGRGSALPPWNLHQIMINSFLITLKVWLCISKREGFLGSVVE